MNPSNSVFRTGIGKLWDFATGLLGSTGNKEDAIDALRILDPDAIAENYWMLHCQPRSAWTHELDLRPWIEKW